MRIPLPGTTELSGGGLVLREWTEADLSSIVRLFDDRDIAYRLPVASPFDHAAAREFLERAAQERSQGKRLQLAITTDGFQPKGEVMLDLRRGTILLTDAAPEIVEDKGRQYALDTWAHGR